MNITPTSSPNPIEQGKQEDNSVEQLAPAATSQGLQVLGAGKTPTGQAVRWVETDNQTAAMFADALARTYGSGIASAISNELGLHLSGSVSKQTIDKAIDMAETSRHALAGVDFALRLDCMAVSNSRGFLEACARTGVNAADISPQQRQAIDAAMEQHFEQAAIAGRIPVSIETANAWLDVLVQQRG